MQREMSLVERARKGRGTKVPQTVYGRLADHDKTRPRPTTRGRGFLCRKERGILMRGCKEGVRNQTHDHDEEAVESQCQAESAKQCLAPVAGATEQKATLGQ
jgi:hypothetical protein